MLLEDEDKFDVDKFKAHQIMNDKFRCIRYFDDTRTKKYRVSNYYENRCVNYKYDYFNFILHREKVYLDNFVKKVLIYTLLSGIIYMI